MELEDQETEGLLLADSHRSVKHFLNEKMEFLVLTGEMNNSGEFY